MQETLIIFSVFFIKDNELLKNIKKSGVTSAKLIIKNNYIQQLYKKWNKFLERENHSGFKGNEIPEDSHCIYLLVS